MPQTHQPIHQFPNFLTILPQIPTHQNLHPRHTTTLPTTTSSQIHFTHLKITPKTISALIFNMSTQTNFAKKSSLHQTHNIDIFELPALIPIIFRWSFRSDRLSTLLTASSTHFKVFVTCETVVAVFVVFFGFVYIEWRVGLLESHAIRATTVLLEFYEFVAGFCVVF